MRNLWKHPPILAAAFKSVASTPLSWRLLLATPLGWRPKWWLEMHARMLEAIESYADWDLGGDDPDD